ncbi:unnamed protein product, partial [Rotaria magnacalcarata]
MSNSTANVEQESNKDHQDVNITTTTTFNKKRCIGLVTSSNIETETKNQGKRTKSSDIVNTSTSDKNDEYISSPYDDGTEETTANV